MSSRDEITDVAYWNQAWDLAGKVKRISERDPRFGRNGLFLRIMRRYMSNLSQRSVIELGGACSYRSLALTKWCDANVTLVDYSPVGIARTNEIFSSNGCSAETILEDFFMWDYGRRKFDLVMHFGLIEHLSSPDRLLQICADLLAPRGIVIFSMPNMEAWGASLWRRWSPTDWSKHIHHTDADMEAACTSAGMVLTSQFHWGPPMLQMAVWEYPGLLPQAFTLAQRGLNLIGRAFPVYDNGWRRISMFRGFVADILSDE